MDPGAARAGSSSAQKASPAGVITNARTPNASKPNVLVVLTDDIGIDQQRMSAMDAVEITDGYGTTAGRFRQFIESRNHVHLVVTVRNAAGRNRIKSLAINEICPTWSAAKSPAKPCTCAPNCAASNGGSP